MRNKKTRGNGEGSIFQRKRNGKTIWVSQYPICKTNGRYKYKVFYGKTRTEVKEKLEEFVVLLRTNKYVEKNQTTLIDLIAEIIENKYRANRLSDNSYLRKQGTLNQIKKHPIANMPIQNITDADIRDFLSSLTKYSNSTISKAYALLNTAFRRAIKKNILTKNPFEDREELPVPKSEKKDKKVSALKLNEQKKFIDAILHKEKKCLYKYQYLISMFTGMRMGEINALTLDDIDFENKTLLVRRTLTRDISDKTIMGKTTKTYAGTRELLLDDFVLNMLKEYINTEFVLNPQRLLFFDAKKTYISTSQVNSAFKRLCQKYDIADGWNVNQHMLRHTYATRCIESGMPAKVVQKQMGHKDLSTTLETYTDVFEQYEKENTSKAFSYMKENGLI